MRIDIISIFPEFIEEGFGVGVIGRGAKKGLLDLRVHDLRQETTDVHQTVDSSPFGGGAGMVMRPEPVFGLLEAVEPPRPLIYLGPAGRQKAQRETTVCRPGPRWYRRVRSWNSASCGLRATPWPIICA